MHSVLGAPRHEDLPRTRDQTSVQASFLLLLLSLSLIMGDFFQSFQLVSWTCPGPEVNIEEQVLE